MDARNGDASKKVISVAMMELVRAPVTEKEVRSQSQIDPVLNLVFSFVLDGKTKMDGGDVRLKPYLCRLTEFSCEGGCLFWSN